ncbi:MAG: hydantoinase/oxoprolinase family protein [Pseudomonadota bacterium]
MSNARIAVDIGGTFTDIALERPGRPRITGKTLTTHQDPAEGVLRVVAEALQEGGLAPGDVSMFIHGTTLATNALIERRGAETALLTTEGHRDALEMAYENRFEQYDINIDRPAPLAPRWRRLPIRERMNKDGKVLIPLDEDSVHAIVPALDHEKIESIAIGFLHAYANKAHEERTAEILHAARPDLSITLASEVAPEIREYERLSTAVANAYVRPLMEGYLRRLEGALRAGGFQCPFYLISSGGGLTTLETAARFPIRLVESGPAGGAVLAASIAHACETPALLSFDMGGTTAKICMIDDYAPQMSRTFEVDRSYRFKKGSGLPVRIPVIEMVEIGAGGGSIASVDKMNRICVGPESAGSEPGPAAYDLGGERPTVTDADVALGKIIPARFAGGAIALNENAAKLAIARDVGARLDLAGDDGAFGVMEIVDENMANAARAHAVEWGKDISARAMVAFGGAAPLHAARLAEKLGIDTIIIPMDAGVGSAVGFLLAPAAYEVVRSRYMSIDDFDAQTAEALFAEMHKEAFNVLAPAIGTAPVVENRRAYMRYAGQGHEVAVDIARDEPLSADLLRRGFEEAYARLYDRRIPNMRAEVLTWALTLSGPAPESPRIGVAATEQVAASQAVRDVFDAAARRRLSYDIHERNRLSPGDVLRGPALIVEDQSTTVVTSPFDAKVNAAGYLILTRKGAAQ